MINVRSKATVPGNVPTERHELLVPDHSLASTSHRCSVIRGHSGAAWPYANMLPLWSPQTGCTLCWMAEAWTEIMWVSCPAGGTTTIHLRAP